MLVGYANAAFAVPKDAKMLGGNGAIKRNTKLKSMDIPLDYEIGLDVTPNNNIVWGKYASILHFTATGTNCCGYGSRIPGVWFYPGTRMLYGVHGHTKNGDSRTGQWKCDRKVLTLEANKKYRVKMVFKRKTVSVWVNNKAACTDIPRADRRVFKNVHVYVGDPWHAPAQATVENLYFKGGESFFALVLMVYVFVCLRQPYGVNLLNVCTYDVCICVYCAPVL